MQSELVLSTCGTSLLTNNTPRELSNMLRRTANCHRDELTAEEGERIALQIASREEELFRAELQSVTGMAAELNALLHLYDYAFPSHGQTVHILLHTDTWQGDETARILASWLQSHGLTVQRQTFKGLHTGDLESFMSAMSDITRWVTDTLPGYRAQGCRVIFNLVGGFKSLQGFVQTLGMLYADEILYIFEGTHELLRIPRLPISLDAASIVESHLETFRQLTVHGHLPVAKASGLPETLLLRIDKDVALSVWGELVWQESRRVLYRRRLFPPPTDLVRLDQSVRRAAERLEGNRLYDLNVRMDELARFAISGRQVNLSGLNVRRLRGDPQPPSTHECNAWSDGDARRLFVHFDGPVVIVDALAPALH